MYGNSRDQHEKTWCPTFTYLHNTPHNIRTLPEKAALVTL